MAGQGDRFRLPEREQFRIESALDPLRNRADFKKLTAAMEKDAPPQQEKK